jgi:Polyketide cyclase / dehydrase and lipid transport
MEWEFVHSVECSASREFAWQFWTHVDNWMFDVSVESVRLDGPFATGTTGTTKPRGGDPINWQLVDVQDGHSALIEINLPGAVVTFRWQFAELSNAATRITQQVTLAGERAADYIAGAAELEKGIPQGMRTLAEEITKAAQRAAHEGGRDAETG